MPRAPRISAVMICPITRSFTLDCRARAPIARLFFTRQGEHCMRRTRRQFLKTAATGAGAVISTVAFPMVARGQSKKLVVWWDRSYYKEEDEAMLKIAEEFRKAKHVDVDVSFAIQEDGRNRMINALTARRGPDVAYYVFNDWEVMPKFAWEGQLVETA